MTNEPRINIASTHVRKHEARPSRVKKKKMREREREREREEKKEEEKSSVSFPTTGFICAGVSNVGGYK